MRKIKLWWHAYSLSSARDMIVTSTWATTTNPLQFLAATRELRKRRDNNPKLWPFTGALKRGNA
jgi:hypothetical protein